MQNNPPLTIGIVLAVFFAAIAIAYGVASTSPEAEEHDGTVAADGQEMPPAPEPGQPDPAVGETPPEVTGADFDGDAMTLPADIDGRQAVTFNAHWCPFCQEEVPELTAWADDHPDLAEQVVVVSTLHDPSGDEYPPEEWIASTGWDASVFADDDGDTAARAWGLTGTPYWVLLEDDGTVAERVSGRIPFDDLTAFLSGS